ncbi:MAG: sulfotransferase [Sulfitobacter sp.]
MKRVLRRAAAHLRPAPQAVSQDRPRYFIASPYKTATTTVGAALIELGAGQRDMRYARAVMQAHRAEIAALTKAVPRDISAKDYLAAHGPEVRERLKGLLPHLERYDVFSDAPFGHSHIHPFILKALSPQARFIWVNRGQKDWLASVRAWEEKHPDVYPRHVEWARDADARAKLLCQMRRQRLRRLRRLAQDFPHDCLMMDIADLQSWKTLADFCGLPAPEGAPGQHNVSRAHSPD